MPAFVLGATGFVGREVVRQLCVRGGKPIAHVRPNSRRVKEWSTKLAELGAIVDNTAWGVSELAAALQKHRATELYILIGTTRSQAKAENVSGDIYQEVDFGLTRMAVDAAKASGLAIRLVYLSSIGADPSARSAYMKARGQAEDAVRAAGIPWVIARPSLIVGERDELRIGEKVGAGIGDGVLAVAGLFGGKRLRAKYKSTSPDVLASALIRIAEAPEHDRIFDGDDLR